MFDMETCISSKIPLQKHSSQQCQRLWSHVFKSKFKFTERELSISTSTGKVCQKFCRKRWQKRPRCCYMKHVEAGQPVLAVLAKFWTSHWVLMKRKNGYSACSIRFHSLDTNVGLQAHLILMFRPPESFFGGQLSLAVNLQRYRSKPPMLGSPKIFDEQFTSTP